ncbi:MAG: hypothetical protein PHD76_09800, partial [Methylacidiphilales bacterium]|nr:hypothetical protein [Candidatus Methylacidiphilales bacterium]
PFGFSFGKITVLDQLFRLKARQHTQEQKEGIFHGYEPYQSTLPFPAIYMQAQQSVYLHDNAAISD